jgi:pyrimidine-nucleoside phosphorylase
MSVIPLIERKRNGAALTAGEWSHLITEYTAGQVPEYQMAALLMAVFLNGLTQEELDAMTEAMTGSGSRFEFGPDVPPRIDKHSTGGVGDKVSLVLAPLVASCGVAVPMMSGRGLGHTGGTLDKLESIPGFRTDLRIARAREQVERIGCALIAQTEEIVPADRKLYALRNATATIEAIPLMAASIMSKKLAEDLNGLVLDIKRGSGAFLPELKDGLDLAQTMVALGENRGCPTVALVTAMDRPLGSACGNALETLEAIRALRGDGPADLLEIVYALGVEMLLLAGLEKDGVGARRKLEQALGSGAAAEKFAAIVEAQEGDPQVLEKPDMLPQARLREDYVAPQSGYVTRVDPRRIGRAVVELGGGRQTTADAIDHSVGFVITARPGDSVAGGEPLATVHARNGAGIALGMRTLQQAIVIKSSPGGVITPLVSHRVTKDGVETVN